MSSALFYPSRQHRQAGPYYPYSYQQPYGREIGHGHRSRTSNGGHTYPAHPYYGSGRSIGTGSGPVSLPTSVLTSSPTAFDPFSSGFALDQPFHQPFLSLFNDTFSQLDRLSDELNDHLNAALTGANNDNGTTNGNGEVQGPDETRQARRGFLSTQLAWAPKFDIKETEHAYVLEGEMPGIERKNVNIEWTNDDHTLVIRGTTESYREEGQEQQKSAMKKIDTPGTYGNTADLHVPDGKDASSSTTTTMNGASASTDAEAKKDNDTTTPSSANDASVTTMTTTSKNTNNDNVAKSPSTTVAPTYHLTERMVGTFQRMFTFPAEIDHDGVKASMKNGLLTVTIPKVVKNKDEEKKRVKSVEIQEVKDENDSQNDVGVDAATKEDVMKA